jgi:hypothetical protein
MLLVSAGNDPVISRHVMSCVDCYLLCNLPVVLHVICCCSVAQAITKAIQISLAATLKQDPSSFTISPQAFYYCAVPAGRSCKTGCAPYCGSLLILVVMPLCNTVLQISIACIQAESNEHRCGVTGNMLVL